MSPTTPRANRHAFAALLRRAMVNKYGQGATNAQLAEDSGVSAQTLSRWFREAADPTPDSLKKISPVLGISLADMLAVAEIVGTGDGDAVVLPTADLATAGLDFLSREGGDLPKVNYERIERAILEEVGRLQENIKREVKLARYEAQGGEQSEDEGGSVS